jgi:membrane dipeptidase
MEERINRLQARGLVDLHFDLLMDLYEKRDRRGVLATEFLPEFDAGYLAVFGAAIYLEDRYIPEMALRVALDQIARLYAEVDMSDRFAICKSYQAILEAQEAGRIAVLITMEGVEPIGNDLDLLRVFFELGVRSIGLTHVRRNAAGSGGVFKASGSSNEGLTSFGRELVQSCERFGVIVDLAHINPKGFEDVFAATTKPLIVSHTNVRRYYDIERNISDEQIRMIGERRGVIGINSVLVSPDEKEATLDRYIDHIEHAVGLIGIDCVGIGFDFFEFIYRQWTESERQALAAKVTMPHFIPGLTNHADVPNLIRRLIERGFSEDHIAKVLSENWMRIFAQLL